MSSNMPLPLGPALKHDVPDIESAVRVQKGLPENISYEDKSIQRLITRTDPAFFEVFNFPITSGNSSTVLSDIQNIALTKSTALALFGETNPMGKQLKIGKKGEEKFFTVTSLIKDPPRNSSIHFDAVARIETSTNYEVLKNDWGSNASNLFLKISKESNAQIVENKLIDLAAIYYPTDLERLKREHPEIKENRELLSLNITNIEDIHFKGEKSAPLVLIYVLMALGAFILLIACFNFVNLNIAQSFKRSRELGVRKTLGAFKGQLFLQLWSEAFILCLIGFVFGLGIAYLLLPEFNTRFGVGIQIATLFQPYFLMILTAVFLLVTLLAGGYPALKMTNFKLVEILKGNVSAKKPGALRNSLLISQFAISSLLICVSIIAGQQLDFLQQKPIGFEREQVVSIPAGYQQDGRKILSRLRNELANDPAVLSVSGTEGNLGRGRDRVTSKTTVGYEYNQNHISANLLSTDFDYLKTLQIPIIKGRDFNRGFATDTVNALVITESFAKAMGEDNPVGKFLGNEKENLGDKIIGVVPDFNAFSPSEKALPIAIRLSNNVPINYLLVKIQSENPKTAMDKLSLAWNKVSPGNEFNASFLNENLQAWYEEESMMTNIFGMASAIAIFLSCLGLFAISLMVIELRTKEIGIRKVMGASVKGIVSMISFHFLRLVLISLLIALPIAWFAMQSWIENYVYRIKISALTFIWIGLLVIGIALATVSYHAIKAAITNPVKSLRTE